MQKLARIKGFSLWGILSYLYNVGRSSFFQTGKNNTVLDLYPKSDLNLSLSMIRACDRHQFYHQRECIVTSSILPSKGVSKNFVQC